MRMFSRLMGWRRRHRQQSIVKVLSEAKQPLTPREITIALGHSATVLGADLHELEQDGAVVGHLEDRCMPATPTSRPRAYVYTVRMP